MSAKILLATYIVLFAMTGTANAEHPLITDDTGTQGKGKTQIEFDGEYGHDKGSGATTNSLVVPTTPVLSYGVADTMDLVLSISHQRIETKQDGVTTINSGISDASVEMKWRYYEKSGLSLAIKPGIILPTGDENKGLGNGKASYHAFLITTKDMTPWAFHINVGYIHNDYKLQADEDANRKDLWHVSLASQVEVVKSLRVVANIGMERNSLKASKTNPAFVLGGLIYSISEKLNVDFGVKGGLNGPETDISYLAGITWKL